MKRTIAFLAALVLLLTLHLPVQAAEATIDTERTGSITLYKYDLTSATGNGVPVSSFVATGETNSAAESTLADYAICGVQFTYLKVAEVVNLTTTSVVGNSSVSLLYAMTIGDRTAALLSTIGLSYEDAYRTDESFCYFTSDVLNYAISAVMNHASAAKNDLENYVKSNGGTTLDETDAMGKAVASDLSLGLYLMVETYVPENVTCTVNPFFVSVPMTTSNGEKWLYDVTIYPKNETGKPTLEKTVREAMEDTGKKTDYTHMATASIGDEVEYEILSKLPTITSEATYLTVYTFVDTMSKGISYNRGDVTLNFYTDLLMQKEVAHWTEDDGKFSVQYDEDGEGSTMTITLTQEGLAEVNRTTTIYPSGSVCSGYSDCYLVIRYAATINNEAVLGDEANPNLVTLKWKRTNTAYYDILEDDCHVYSYGIDLLKQFHGANAQDADGNFSKVKFILRNETDDYFLSADLIDGVYYIRDHVEEKDATVFSPDAEGKILIRGLEDDIYRLKEIATDHGYQLLAEEVKIEIIVSESAAICDVCGRSLLTATAKVTDQEVTMEADGASSQAFVPLTIINNHGFDLPPTGSQGTWFLSILGIAGMAVCGVLLALLLKKRKQNTA